jgi:hypothetical protein
MHHHDPLSHQAQQQQQQHQQQQQQQQKQQHSLPGFFGALTLALGVPNEHRTPRAGARVSAIEVGAARARCEEGVKRFEDETNSRKPQKFLIQSKPKCKDPRPKKKKEKKRKGSLTAFLPD